MSTPRATGQKVWFITGSSRGFGREWAAAALDRGDLVAATARHPRDLQGLVDRYGDAVLPLRLDVTDRDGAFDAVARAHTHFGRLDVVVNNAGFGQFGMVEELGEAEARAQLETNVLGVLWVTQAALPYLRAQRSGHLVQVSSICGIDAYPNIAMYCATKFAVEGLSQGLAKEVEGFGIHVTLVEPGGYDTDWAGSSAARSEPIPAYDGARQAALDARARRVGTPGDPSASAIGLLAVVDAARPPLRILLGDGPLRTARREYERRLQEWTSWAGVSVASHGGGFVVPNDLRGIDLPAKGIDGDRGPR
ncbi:MAG: short-chain dehydrogenase/reductase [Pseudonocardia sp. SCN 72-86]|nr:MAG: short-chain dehydrogenase/reductase [Pseudonocardia sp. SCN 72-86]